MSPIYLLLLLHCPFDIIFHFCIGVSVTIEGRERTRHYRVTHLIDSNLPFKSCAVVLSLVHQYGPHTKVELLF